MDLTSIDDRESQQVEEHPRLRFGLRTFLIAITVLGVVVGLLGRTWNRNPELFLAMVKCSPFIIGGVVLYYSIRVLRKKQQPWTLTIALVAGCLYFVVGVVGLARLDTLTFLPSKYLVEKRLSQNMDDHDVWREIERRIMVNRFASQDMDALVQTLLASGNMDSTKLRKPPFRLRSPLQRGWVRLGFQRDLISDKNLVAMADEYFAPPMTRRIRLREGRGCVRLQAMINYGRDFYSYPLQLAWDVDSVDLDDRKVEFLEAENSAVGDVEENFSVGLHKLNVYLVCAYVPRTHVPTSSPGLIPYGGSSAGFLKEDEWRNTLKEWKRTITIPVEVYGEPEEIITLVEAKDLDPSEFFSLVGITYKPPSSDSASIGWVEAYAKAEPYPKLPLPIAMCCDVFLVNGNDRIEIGTFVAYHDLNGKCVYRNHRKPLDAPIDPVFLQNCDVEFIPNPRNENLEQFTNITEIWGRSITVKDCEVKAMPQRVPY